MPRAVVFYDADCGFCKWSLAKLLAWDRHRALRPVALQDEEADRLLGPMDPERKMASWHLVEEDGSVRSAGRAVPPLFRLLPGGRPVAALAERFGGATESTYQWVARHRGLLGRRLTARARARADAEIRRAR